MKSKKRKFYMVLPILALPFITLAFWAMGGGRGQEEVKSYNGLNLQLPDAKLKDDRNADKLSFYKEADKDSLLRSEDMKNDPGYHDSVIQLIPHSGNVLQSPFTTTTDANEQKIYKKINELKQQINTPVETNPLRNNSSADPSVEKLQNMLQMMNQKKENDPEMDQLGGMLDKILDIQHPERVTENKSLQHKQQTFPVGTVVKNDNISLMQSGRTDTARRKVHNSFFDLGNTSVNEVTDNSIEAVIHQTQTLASGSTVKLRLTTDLYINGILIPKGNFIYGTASLENERLSVKVSSIRYQNNLLPVSLEVYDMDGIAGIYVPGSGNEVRRSAEENLQKIELSSLEPSLAGQAASSGINTVKNLLTKKIKLVKVTLKAGYKVLLKDKI